MLSSLRCVLIDRCVCLPRDKWTLVDKFPVIKVEGLPLVLACLQMFEPRHGRAESGFLQLYIAYGAGFGRGWGGGRRGEGCGCERHVLRTMK